MFTQEDLDLIAANNATLRRMYGSVITTPTPVEWGGSYRINIPVNSGYDIEFVTCNVGSLVLNWTVASDGKSASWNSDYDADQLSNFSMNVIPEKVKGLFSEDFITQINANNCDLYHNEEVVTTELKAVAGETYEIKCRNGWVISEETIEFDRYNSGTGIFGVYLADDGYYKIHQWNISADRKTATTVMPQLSRYGLDYTELYLLVEQTAEIDVLGGVNNVYKVDNEIMKQLTSERFFITNIGEGGEYVRFDYGQYIINLMQMPFAIPESNILDSEFIRMATLKTETLAPLLNTDRVIYDMGSIEVNAFNNNLLDYTNKQAILHLPFSDPIILDNQYIINETISITLEINLYTGTGTYNIYSSKISEVIVTKTVTLGVNIPLANFHGMDSQQLLTSSLEWSGDNKLRVAYIELVDTNSDLNNGFFNSPIMDDTVLNDVEGFFTTLNINLVLQAPSSEKSKIISMLQEGVIIK